MIAKHYLGSKTLVCREEKCLRCKVCVLNKYRTQDKIDPDIEFVRKGANVKYICKSARIETGEETQNS